MKRTFSTTMLVIGTVIGSGFASGKEISVYFSRFGTISYFFIALTFLLFFGTIYLFLSQGERIISRISSSKFFSAITYAVCVIFTSAMFAGAMNIVENSFLKIVVGITLLLCCVIVVRRGLNALSTLNSVLMPLTLVSMGIVLFSNISLPNAKILPQNAFAGLFFTILYVFLNFSISSVVIARAGMKLSKKQKVWASFFASLTLSVFLLLTNFVLLSHPESFQNAMPLVSLASGLCALLIRFVVFSGCITTLFSLVITSSSSLEKLGSKGAAKHVLSHILPFALSFLGFGTIVNYLYPFASVLGSMIVLILFLLPQKAS